MCQHLCCVSGVQRTGELYVGELPVNVRSADGSYWRLGVTLRKGLRDSCNTHVVGGDKTWFWLELPGEMQEDRLFRRMWEVEQAEHVNDRLHGCCTPFSILPFLFTPSLVFY